ncbi:hypothetical protein WICPIJ_009597 [Wickerhamomyces pijperi]|uniref:Uncharacterized protein n=1 Tax=Wickerhamomyces pijperi TaxID=599730 RepID=A0A9P8TDH2_WICPI|nr:hypothetical protein WICPIJ_009597 [Wickerhamomyces pijperi]
MAVKKQNKPTKQQNKPTIKQPKKSFKISKSSTKSNSIKMAKLDQVELTDLFNSEEDDSQDQKSVIDVKDIKKAIVQDKEKKEKDKHTENDLMSQLDSLLEI